MKVYTSTTKISHYPENFFKNYKCPTHELLEFHTYEIFDSPHEDTALKNSKTLYLYILKKS